MSKNDKAAKNAAQRSADPPLDGIRIDASKTTVLLICGSLALLILGAAFAGFCLGNNTRSAGAPGSAGKEVAVKDGVLQTATGTFRVKPGPWGELECQRTVIEIPDEFLSIRLHEGDVPHWFFKGYSAAMLTKLLEDAQLSAEEKRDLLDASKWETSPAGIQIKPAEKISRRTHSCRRKKTATGWMPRKGNRPPPAFKSSLPKKQCSRSHLNRERVFTRCWRNSGRTPPRSRHFIGRWQPLARLLMALKFQSKPGL